jgi:hypothetical protein
MTMSPVALGVIGSGVGLAVGIGTAAYGAYQFDDRNPDQHHALGATSIGTGLAVGAAGFGSIVVARTVFHAGIPGTPEMLKADRLSGFGFGVFTGVAAGMFIGDAMNTGRRFGASDAAHGAHVLPG